MRQYDENYKVIYNWFMKPNSKRFAVLKVFYKLFPILSALIYIGLIFYCVSLSESFNLILENQILMRVVIVPFVTFASVTVMRKFIDAKRPYIKYNYIPLIDKEKTGESFPSRHTLSAAIIAMACLYVNIYLGVIAWIIAVIVGATRYIGGVHFFKDVIFGILIAILCGVIGFWVI